MDIRLLGPIEVLLDGRALDLGSHKQKALLAALALAAPGVVSTDRLLEDLWGEDALDKRNALWIHVSRLRAALVVGTDATEPVLLTHDHGYSLAIDPADVDVNRFEDEVHRGLALVDEAPEQAEEVLDRALAAWRGPPLADVTYEDFAQPTIRHLTEVRARAIDGRLEAAHRTGRSHELLDLIETVRGERPLDERFVRHHVLALAAVGRVTDALRMLRRFRSRLAADLGVEPSPSMVELEDQLRHRDLVAVARPVLAGRTTTDRPGGPGPGPEDAGRGHAPVSAAARPAVQARTPGPATPAPARGRRRRLRRRSLAVAVLVTLLAAAGVTAVLRDDTPRIGVIIVPSDGVHHRQLDEGFARASQQFDIETEALVLVTDVDDQVRDYLDTDPDLVVLDSSIETVTGVPLQSVVDAHTAVRFVITASTGDPPSLVGENVTVITYASEQGGFLAGAVAAMESRTGVVGFVGAAPSAVDDVRAGFEAGVRQVDPSVQVLSTHVVAAPYDVWASPVAARDAATRLFDRGADVILQVAGTSGRGVLTAAVEGSARLGRHLWVIGSDVDEWLLADADHRDHVLTSVVERHDLGIVRAIERFLAGDDDDVLMGVAEGGMALSAAGDHLAETTLERIASLVGQVTTGEVAVPSLPDAPPTAPPDGIAVRVDATEDGCAAEGLPVRVTPDDTLTVTVANRTERDVDLELWPVVAGSRPPVTGTPSELVPLSMPWSSATATPGGSNAITVRLGPAELTTGRWALWCIDATTRAGTRTEVFHVLDAP